MRFASFSAGGRDHWGLVTDTGLVAIDSRSGAPATLLDALRGGALSRFADETGGLHFAFDNVSFRPPVLAPEKIICVGVNYADRNAEYKDGSTQGKYPSLFVRFPGSFVGHEQPLVRPSASPQFDYEGEIVLVIGRSGRHVPRERALDMIEGLTLGNEGSVRDWLRHGKFNVTQGKNFDRSGSLGPWLVSKDALDLGQPFRLTTRVNGEVRQDDTTANMIFGFADLITYITTFATLHPGDLILSGTPVGAGARFDPPRWLVAGDVVEVEVPGIGALRNHVVDEADEGGISWDPAAP